MKAKGRMSFKDYVFPINPSVIRITHKRQVAINKIPGGLSKVEDLGIKGRIISGEGEFFGSECEKHFEELKELFDRGGGGMLYIPSQKPIYAVFENLELIGKDIEGLIKYGFEFAESFDKEHRDECAECIGNGQNTLWDFAYEYNTDVGELLELNPDISRPDISVPRGKRVRLCRLMF